MTDNSLSDTADQTPAGQGISLWPALIIAMLGGQAILMLVMVYMATSDPSFAVEPDYYQKALHWDDMAARQRVSNQLGWSVAIAVSDQADLYKVRRLTCLLTDRNGEPIDGAEIEMLAFSHAQGSQRIHSVLEPAGAGRYHTDMRVVRPGLWEFRIAARHGDQQFIQTQTVKIAAAGGTR